MNFKFPAQILVLTLSFFLWGAAAHAQVASEPAQGLAVTPLPNSISEAKILSSISQLEDTELSAEAQSAITETLRRAITQLSDAKASQENAARFENNTASHDEIMADLSAQLEAVQTELNAPIAEDVSEITNASLSRMEQELRSLEAESTRIATEIASEEAQYTALIGREQLARSAKTQAQNILEDIRTEIAALTKSAKGRSQEASHILLYARRYAREHENNTLSQEIANIPLLQEQLNLSLQIARAQAQSLGVRIESLRDKTGLLRTQEADYMISEALLDIELAKDQHPLVLHVAAENFGYAQQIKTIAQAGDNVSIMQVRLNDRLQQLREDNALAAQIAKEGNIDRKYGAVLRRLRENIRDERAINKEIETRQKIKLDVSLERILAQDKLREFTIGRVNIAQTFAAWFADNLDAASLSQDEEALLRSLYSKQRNLLTELIDNASTKSAEIADLNTIQQQILSQTQELKQLLDQRLLWLPSTERLGLSWPGEIMTGISEVFAPSKASTAIKDFTASIFAHIFLIFAAVIVFFLCLNVRSRLSSSVLDMKMSVGRVQKDSFKNTPLAVLAGIVWSLPICWLGIIIGFLFFDSDGSSSTLRLGQALINVSVLCLSLLTIKRWSEDGRLFDVHFKVKKHLRDRLAVNLPWFIIAQTISVFLMTVCDGYENDQEGAALGLLGFLIGTLSAATFIYRMLWSAHAHIEMYVSETSFIGRNKKLIFGGILALPFFTSILAVCGYFATAMEVQNRLILTAGLLILAYVIYGVMRRTVVLMQRRLALEQMKLRREKMLKERAARNASEGAPEQPLDVNVQALNYDEIDVETISRQSTQLLNIIVAIAVGAMGWVLWAELLPALSVFNDVKLPFEKMNIDSDGERQAVSATLWDFIKAIFTVILTFLAAKNLPGFLDLFILKRSGITPGSRYAITTVLGYAIVITGILVVSDQIGIEWSNLQWIVAALSVGVGFGLQEIIANFISGLIILFERPVRLGDYVTIGDQSGTISRIQIRATTLSDLDNREILIPNRELIAGRVTNWTLSNSTLRIIIPVGIAYGSDTDAAQKIILDTVKGVKGILDMPEPQVLFLGFGDSALDFEIRIFLPSFNSRFPVAHDVHTAVNKALETAGISIPFPQRDLHIISNPAS